MTIYMKTTNDKLDLPVAVADNARELANMLGVSVNSVWSCISKGISGYHKIVLPEVYPDNDGGLWFKDPDTGQIVYEED